MLKDWPGGKCGCGQRGWGPEYDAFLTMPRRDELPPHATCDGCALGRGVTEDNIHMLIFMCPSHLRRRLFATACAIRSRTADACRHGVQKYLKTRTGLLKMGDKCDGLSVTGNSGMATYPTRM